MASAAAADAQDAQLQAVRRARAAAYHGVRNEPPLQLRRAAATRAAAAEAAEMKKQQTQLQEVRAAQRQAYLRAGRVPEREAAPSILEGADCDTREAREMLEECNRLRRREGLGVLAWSSRLAAIAERAAQRMGRRELPFSHDGADERFAEYPLGPGDTYGENLARSEGIWPLARTVVQGWAGSPGHYRNLIGPFSACGIGVATSEVGVTLIVQLFALVPGDVNETSNHAEADNVEDTSEPFHKRNRTSAERAVLLMIVVLALLLWKGGWLASILSS